MRVLFVCTGNTCRSPMAERIARTLLPGHHFESAGIEPGHWINPVAERVLVERGVDPNGFEPRNVLDVDLEGLDLMVLIGRKAQTSAPRPEGPGYIFWDVADPYEVEGREEDVLRAYRQCADQLGQLVCGLELGEDASAD